MQTYSGQTDTLTPCKLNQVYRALLHQYSMTWLNADIPSVDVPPNQAQLYRALLHQDSMTYYKMHCYLVPIDPPIEPTCTEPYYTKTVLPIDKCRHTQGRQTPPPHCKLTPSV